MNKKTVDDIQVKLEKKVLVRCDFNVPIKDGKITDETRRNGAMPTIQKLVDEGAKVILCSHMGKPKGQVVESLSLAPVAKSLSEKLGKNVVFADDDNVVGENAKAAVAAMNDGDVVLLQNTRFRPEETKRRKFQQRIGFSCRSFCKRRIWKRSQSSLFQLKLLNTSVLVFRDICWLRL